MLCAGATTLYTTTEASVGESKCCTTPNITQQMETCLKYLPQNLEVDVFIFAIHSVDRRFTELAEGEEELGHPRLIKEISFTKFFEVLVGKYWIDEFFNVGYVYNVEKWVSITG
ncbi:hypothetical protein BCON_0102g00180 [Botryotinia convoluta]|uniref:Uncharacterized protein n=1 Tax=Botryotinia convoluta TaxID=54673 RepID=A0A4Z1I016_9HELO|nr:hypothetical protein BCON_0102g00180 [Botryotinia convoluta]